MPKSRLFKTLSFKKYLYFLYTLSETCQLLIMSTVRPPLLEVTTRFSAINKLQSGKKGHTMLRFLKLFRINVA